MKADLLKLEFATDALSAPDGRPSDRLLLDSGDTIALIGRATEEGVPIVAVHGLTDGRGGAAAPETADFSAAVAEGHGCWQDAEAFIRARRHQGLVFEVTLGDDPIEAV